MGASRILFVNQTGVMSGAEYVLASLSARWPGASAFLLEGGPLENVLSGNGLNVSVAPEGARLGSIRRDQSLLAALPLAMRLYRLIGEIISAARKSDVVYANSQKAFLLSALASYGFRRPLIWHLHDIMDERHFGALQRKLQIGLANRRASRVVVPSRAAADAFVRAGGRADLVDVVPNGISLEAVEGQDRAALGLPQGPLIGVFSRLAPWKGQHVVLEALQNIPDLQCILVGSALFGEDAYAQRLQTLVAEAGLSDRVRFLGQRSDVPVLMKAVDVVVHPSVDPEPFGLTLVEAMLAGTPVLATDAGASAEILDGGAAGTLVPPGDAGALASALRAFLAAPEPYRAKAVVAGTRVRRVYGIDEMRDRIAGLVEEAAGK